MLGGRTNPGSLRRGRRQIEFCACWAAHEPGQSMPAYEASGERMHTSAVPLSRRAATGTRNRRRLPCIPPSCAAGCRTRLLSRAWSRSGCVRSPRCLPAHFGERVRLSLWADATREGWGKSGGGAQSREAWPPALHPHSTKSTTRSSQTRGQKARQTKVVTKSKSLRSSS